MADFLKLNLAALPSYKIVELKDADGKKFEALVLPIKKNHLFLSEKGNIYMDLVMFKRKEPMRNAEGRVDQTHIIKQSLPEDVRKKMTDDEKKNQPIIGSANIYDGGHAEAAAPEQDTSFRGEVDDDLPF